MNLQDCEALTVELMKQHGIGHWTFRFDNSKIVFGRCWGRRELITLSKRLVEQNEWDEVRNTVLHEIAHALAGCGHGHDDHWKSVACSVGARPERCYSYDKVARVKADWTATCGVCGHVYHRHTMPRETRMIGCGRCSRTFDPRFKLCFTRTIETEEDRIRFARNEASRRCKAKYRGYPREED